MWGRAKNQLGDGAAGDGIDLHIEVEELDADGGADGFVAVEEFCIDAIHGLEIGVGEVGEIDPAGDDVFGGGTGGSEGEAEIFQDVGGLFSNRSTGEFAGFGVVGDLAADEDEVSGEGNGRVGADGRRAVGDGGEEINGFGGIGLHGLIFL